MTKGGKKRADVQKNLADRNEKKTTKRNTRDQAGSQKKQEGKGYGDQLHTKKARNQVPPETWGGIDRQRKNSRASKKTTGTKHQYFWGTKSGRRGTG